MGVGYTSRVWGSERIVYLSFGLRDLGSCKQARIGFICRKRYLLDDQLQQARSSNKL